jgi:hypothetical protein
MKLKFNSSTKVTTLVTAVAVASICVDTAQVYATHKQKHDDRGSVYYYGPAGPNRSGPHTRIYVTKRSWLDAGTEILPGDRSLPTTPFRRDIRLGERIRTGQSIDSLSIRRRTWADTRGRSPCIEGHSSI